jgi:general secretion pathway protein G
VVAIIGLLATLSTVALNSARSRARDTRRVADVKQIQTALELYYNDMGSYPANGSVVPGSPVTSTYGTYMAQVPKSPKPVDGASCSTWTEYVYNGSTNTYTLTYCLGAATGSIASGTGTATPAGIK